MSELCMPIAQPLLSRCVGRALRTCRRTQPSSLCVHPELHRGMPESTCCLCVHRFHGSPDDSKFMVSSFVAMCMSSVSRTSAPAKLRDGTRYAHQMLEMCSDRASRRLSGGGRIFHPHHSRALTSQCLPFWDRKHFLRVNSGAEGGSSMDIVQKR